MTTPKRPPGFTRPPANPRPLCVFFGKNDQVRSVDFSCCEVRSLTVADILEQFGAGYLASTEEE